MLDSIDPNKVWSILNLCNILDKEVELVKCYVFLLIEQMVPTCCWIWCSHTRPACLQEDNLRLNQVLLVSPARLEHAVQLILLVDTKVRIKKNKSLCNKKERNGPTVVVNYSAVDFYLFHDYIVCHGSRLSTKSLRVKVQAEFTSNKHPQKL